MFIHDSILAMLSLMWYIVPLVIYTPWSTQFENPLLLQFNPMLVQTAMYVG